MDQIHELFVSYSAFENEVSAHPLMHVNGTNRYYSMGEMRTSRHKYRSIPRTFRDLDLYGVLPESCIT
jgi:hypothetical protein